MATTSRGIFYPTTSDSVEPATRDFKTLATTTTTAINNAVAEAKWERGTITAGTNLNDVTTAGVYQVTSYSIANSLLNKPPAFAINPAYVNVFNNGATAIQEWQTVPVGSNPAPRVIRFRDNAGVWGAWRRADVEGVVSQSVITANTDLNTLGGTQVYVVPSYSVAITLQNMPPGMTQPMVIKSYVAGSVTFHEATAWVSKDQTVTWVRSQLAGVWSAWAKTSPEMLQTAVQCFGDSLTEGGSINGAWQPAEKWTSILAQYIDLPVTNYGKSGDTSDEVLFRAGLRTVFGLPVGGSIPAGTETVTIQSPYLRDVTRRRAYTMTYAGVAGSLTGENGGWTFVRHTAGQAAPVTAATPFIAPLPLSSKVAVIWFGRNDLLFGTGKPHQNFVHHLKAQYGAAMEAATSKGVKVILPGITYTTNEPVGSPGYEAIREVNAWLAESYPESFVAVTAFLSKHGLDLAGLTPTAADVSAQAAGLIPPSLYDTGDTIHFRKETAAVIGKYFAAQLALRGWVGATPDYYSLPSDYLQILA